MTDDMISALPPEIKRNVTGFIRWPRWLRNLALVSRDWYDIATIHLYYQVDLTLGDRNDHVLVNFAKSTNRGLQHTRILKLHPGPEYNLRAFPKMHNTIRNLIKGLPRDVLEEFELRGWSKIQYEESFLEHDLHRPIFRLETFELLLNTQKRLRSLQMLRLESCWEYKKGAEFKNIVGHEVIKKCQKLNLCISSEEQLPLLSGVLEQAEMLTELKLQVRPCSLNVWNELLASPSWVRPLADLISSRAKLAVVIPLVSVELDNVDMTSWSEVWSGAFVSPYLRRLKIIDCAGSNGLLRALADAERGTMQLSSLRICAAEDSRSMETGLIDNYLFQHTGLQELFVRLARSHYLPSANGIGNQASTLRLLSMQSGLASGGFAVMHEEDLQTICSTCVELEQLSLPFMNLNILESETSARARTLLAMTTTLPKLVTLQVTGLPAMSYSQGVWAFTDLDTELHSLAQDFFDAATRSTSARFRGASSLRLVAFDVRGSGFQQIRDENSHNVFMRGVHGGQGDKKSGNSIERVSRRVWQSEEPENEVIEEYLTSLA
ncbi:Hypothetical protein D9617_4g003120 [Elsinoe fawcettii]|nr:Hypothetical protein D9617_4g003120 [Elsinoe fawcettii]